MRLTLPRTPLGRLALAAPFAAAAVAVLWWRTPSVAVVVAAFAFVRWQWIAAALALNLASVVVRALAWRTVVVHALPRPHPRFLHVFSGFAVGLLGNAVLPGRMGEFARVAVLRRRLPRGEGWTATLVGTVVAHRLFDVVPALLLIAYVLTTARVPHWAITSLVLVAAIGVALFAFAVASARRGARVDGLGTARRLLAMARQGLEVMNAPLAAVLAALLQVLGWGVQLLAVYVAMRAFGIDAPLPAAGLVLLLMNVATVFPLWPGNIGLLQAAVALPLVTYGVAYATGFAYGLGLQMLEMSVGVGVGLVFLAREGLSLAMLRRIEAAGEREVADELAVEEVAGGQTGAARARVPR